MKIQISRWMPISSFIITLLLASLPWSTNCADSPAGYRIIAFINDGGEQKTERMIVRYIQRSSGQDIDLQNAPSLIFSPVISEGGFAIVRDKKFPPVNAILQTSPADEIDVSGRKYSRRSFVISGELAESNLAFAQEGEPGGLCIRSITVEGNGYVVVDETDSSPAAGMVHLVRRALPALWRTDVSEDDLKIEIDAAWTKIP